jgi:hypothetical protein
MENAGVQNGSLEGQYSHQSCGSDVGEHVSIIITMD